MLERKWIVGWLDTLQNNFMVGMAGAFLLEKEEAWPLLHHGQIGFHPPEAAATPENASVMLPVHYVGEAVRNEQIRTHLLRSFHEALFRTLLSEALEKAKEYCKDTGQLTKLYSAPWYNFARVLRNATTHDGYVRFDQYIKPPVVFQQWRFEAEHNGQRIDKIISIPSTTAVPLLQAIRKFVETELA